ncbi:MAG: dockerin type I repeat-containing protein [Clostridia bacterium]|nr:dockerin type I repeat-containing protein [Clostridia bacterium]
MRLFCKKLISAILVLLICITSYPLAASVSAEGAWGEFNVVIRGGSAVFETRNGEFEGAADGGDVLIVTADEAPGRTFEYWRTSEGDAITDPEFRMLVHDNAYISAHYADTSDYPFGDWELYWETDDCEVPSIMIRENARGDAEFKEKYVNYGQHRFGEWEADAQAHRAVCTVCGRDVWEDHEWSEEVVIEEPTHDETGIVYRKCQVCGYEDNDLIPPTDEHKWGEYTVTVPASGSTPGQRSRNCVWCGAAEEATYYLDPDLESLWKDHFMNFYFSTRYGGSREERYYSCTNPDGSVLYVFAMQLTTTNARDYDQTFIFMYTDDGDPTTLEPVYLTKSGSSSSSMMQSFRWAPYDYVHDFAGFVSVIGHPDGVNVPGITQGNNMGGRGATLTWRYDDWAEEINSHHIGTSVDPADIPDNIWYEVEATNVQFAKTNVYDPGGSGTLLYSGGGFDGCTTYRKEVSPGEYEYMTVDPVSGAVVRKIEPVSHTTSYFRYYKEVIDADAYALLTENEKKAYVCRNDIASLIASFTSENGRIGISNFSLEVPDPYTYVRVQVDRTVYGSDFRVSGRNWDYSCYSTNVTGVHRTDISPDYPNYYALTFTWDAENENFDTFERWEMWNFATETWETVSTDHEMVLNTYASPLTDLTVIRPVYFKNESRFYVQVEGGWFCYEGEDIHRNNEEVPIGSRIYLVGEPVEGDLVLTYFEDQMNNQQIYPYSTFTVTDHINAEACYESFHTEVSIETYNCEGGFVCFADYYQEGDMYACYPDEFYYGDTAYVCAISDTENGYTDGDFLGWYRIGYDDYGEEVRTLLSTDMTAEIEITESGTIYAVWNTDSGEEEGDFLEGKLYLTAENGFIALSRRNGGGEYEMRSSGDPYGENVCEIRQNSYSSLMTYGWEEIKMYDDPTDDLNLTGWNVTYTEADTEEEITVPVEIYEEGYATFYIDEYEYYFEGVPIAFVGEGVSAVVIGDVNGDGLVTSKDIRTIKQYLAGLLGDDDINFAGADVNGDGDITSKDIRELKQLLTA